MESTSKEQLILNDDISNLSSFHPTVQSESDLKEAVGDKSRCLLFPNEVMDETVEIAETRDRTNLTDAFLAEILTSSKHPVDNISETNNPDVCKSSDAISSGYDEISKDNKSTNTRTEVVFDDKTRGLTDSVEQTGVSGTEESSIPTSESLKNGYRSQEVWSEDESSSSTSSDSSSDSDAFFETMREGPAPKVFPIAKTKGELDLDELPPIEELIISVAENDMEKIGKVYAIVDKLVVIHALKDSRPLDLDSVLFLQHDRPLGRIFDVFGQVMEPFYSVRFNSSSRINEMGIQIDSDVFYAPQKSDITSYVFVDDLQNQRGSDASWKHNNEPPEEFLDYSDDEQERAARRKRMAKNRNKNFNNSDVASKKPSLAGDTPDRPIYIPPPRPAPRRNLHGPTTAYGRSNPFSTPRPILSPSPSLCTFVTSAPPPFGLSRFAHPFPVHSPPPPLPFQQLQRHPPSPLVLTTYHQQPVFGQVSMLGPISPALHSPSPFNNVPALIPAAHLSPQNYFNQRFNNSPSPGLQNGQTSPDPWLPNQAPYQQSNHLPPNTPLTVQIPPNISSPTVPVHSFENSTVQPFMNQNVNFPQRFVNHQNVNYPNGNVHSRFY